jgi:hypothetical protein
MQTTNEAALDSRARRAAKRAGLIVRKWRGRLGTVDNRGGFALINPEYNFIIAGERFNLTAQDVIDICESAEA